MRRLDTTELLHSKTIEAIVSILVKKGYLENYTVEDIGNNKKVIKVALKYDDENKSVIMR